MKKIYAAALLAIVLMSACKKDDDVAPPSVADKLVNGVWKPVQAGEDANKNNTLESAELIPLDACETDDTYDYKDDKTLVINDNAQKCDPSDPSTTTVNWSLSNNDTELLWSAPGSPISITWKLLEVTDNILRLGITDGTDQYIMVYGK